MSSSRSYLPNLTKAMDIFCNVDNIVCIFEMCYPCDKNFSFLHVPLCDIKSSTKINACRARGPGSNLGLATRVFRDWLSPDSKS